MPYTFDSNHGPGVSNAGLAIDRVPNYTTPAGSVSAAGFGVDRDFNINDLASEIAGKIGFDASDFGDAIREGLSNYSSSAQKAMNSFTDMLGNYLNQANQYAKDSSELSQQYAREQMEYQTQSDKYAMAWSANEAQKNRQWQERLSNSAHQREVKDLIAAGLNPILSANAGASTGSGATGQGFAAPGAMGNVNESMAQVAGSLFSSAINSANQASLTAMNNQMQKYQADMSYASSKLAAEASIYNNHNTNTASKEIARMNNDRMIEQANISSAASRYVADQNLSGAYASAGAARYSADMAHSNALLNSDAMKYSADKSFEGKQIDSDTAKWLNEHNINQNPVKYVTDGIVEAVRLLTGKDNIDAEDLPQVIVDAVSGPTPSYSDYHDGKNETQTFVEWLDEITGHGKGMLNR